MRRADRRSRSSVSIRTSRRSGRPRTTSTSGRCWSSQSRRDDARRRGSDLRCAASPGASTSQPGAAPDPELRSRADGRHASTIAAPTSSGVYRDDDVGPASTRGCRSSTSPRGQQPMANDDGTLWLGRSTARSSTIVELREELQALGHRFRTRSDTEVIVHAFERWGESCVRAVQRPVRDRALGPRRATAGARARPLRRPPAALSREHDGGSVFASEVEGDLRGRPVDPARVRPRRARSDVHVLGAARAAHAVSQGVARAPARARPGDRRGRTARDGAVLAGPAIPTPVRRSSTAPSTTPPRPSRDGARSRRRACACSAPTSRSAATCRAGSTARSSPRWPVGQRRAGCPTFSLRFDDAEYDETPYQRHDGRAARQRPPRGASSTRRDIAEAFPARGRARRASAAPDGAGAAVPALAGSSADTGSRSS